MKTGIYMTDARSKLFALLPILLVHVSFAQFGPGGVGNSSNNGMWLVADSINQVNGSSVSFWPDISGNGNHAIQATPAFEPQFNTSGGINGRSTLTFDGTDQMEVPDANILDGSAGISYFSVVRPTGLNGAARGIIGKRITFSTNVEYAYTFFFYTGNRLFLDVHTSNNRFNSSSTFSNNTNYIAAMTFDGSLAAASRSRIYTGGSLDQTSTESSTALPNSNQAVAIGALNVDYGTYFIGEMAEIIHFNYCVNAAQRIIVENYLGAKYGISIANDFFTHQATYNHDVAGIGRVNVSNVHDDAQGKGQVRILNPAGLGDNEYYIWGHDNGSLLFNNGDYPSIEMLGRLDRVWRATETGTINSFDVRFDLSGTAANYQPEDMVLLIDTDNDGSFADESSAGGGLIIGSTQIAAGIYEFANVSSLNNNLRFTIGYTNVSGACQVASTNGYSVNISINPVTLVPSSVTCPFGYNYNLDVEYAITFNGANIPANLFTMQGTITCGGSTNFFDLPNNGGSGNVLSVSNVFSANTDCATATPITQSCFTAAVEVQGPGIPFQTIDCSAGVTLPVELISFRAKREEKSITLFWETATEVNNDFFEVQRSENGQDFETIDIIDGMGNSSTLSAYSYVDQPSENYAYYYRLKQVDYDGKKSVSQVVFVDVNVESSQPSKLLLIDNGGNVNVPSDLIMHGNLMVEILNSSGNIVFSKQLTSSYFTTTNLASGLYYVRFVRDGELVEVYRLVAL